MPNNDADLPDNGQFSVVVRSFGAKVVSVVNEHQGTGARAEAMAYDAFNSGPTTVYLPNVLRRFFGFGTPFVIQNLGTNTDTVTATFVSFDPQRADGHDHPADRVRPLAVRRPELRARPRRRQAILGDGDRA
ncbi:MAG TPA: hypothetical protein VHG53_03620 [Candidatus Limnocylindria bacterium]|nr:hypothetical protein [Candidatus Limnocylindria bacterium]